MHDHLGNRAYLVKLLVSLQSIKLYITLKKLFNSALVPTFKGRCGMGNICQTLRDSAPYQGLPYNVKLSM